MRELVILVCLFSATAFTRGESPNPQDLAAVIDQHIAAGLQGQKIKLAPKSDDAEFLRRVFLDITGRIPRPRDIHDFLANKDPRKREKIVDELLDSPRYASHAATVWCSLLISEASANAEAGFFQSGFEAWLKQQFRANVPYDKLVRELLTTPITGDRQDPQAVLREPNLPNQLAFFAVKEARPENLAATTTRLFLGIQLECAQCHNHPFARWTTEQFWSQAAFFAGIERQGKGVFDPLSETANKHEITIEKSKKTIQAEFLDDKRPNWKQGSSSRAVLADWMTAADNPYFAKAAVNRVWGQFFGIGIVDPVDDFNEDNRPSHPELLDDLAQALVAAHFDFKFLIRAICRSDAYQRTSRQTDASQEDARLFAKMPVKGLSGEQFFDSLVQATGFHDQGKTGGQGRRAIAPRARFLSQFAPQGKLSEPQTSITQALTLMNGKFLADATNLETSPTLEAVIETPKMETAERIEALYLLTLSRKPKPYETEKVKFFVEGDGTGRRDERLADLFWILLNSAEFRLNH